MNSDTCNTDKIEKLTEHLDRICRMMAPVDGLVDETVQKLHLQCLGIPAQVRSGIVKIAVVGAIKSGKSTFINSLMGDDLLKRGAGVVTAIVTRVRKGNRLRAAITLKSWDDINADIEKSLTLFPGTLVCESLPQPFDLRRSRDRTILGAIRDRLMSDPDLIQIGFRPETMTVFHALDGYDQVKGIVQADPSVLEFDSKRFHEHQQFTGNDSTAFYVRDVCLEVRRKDLESWLEIADCQGSDSTDALHLAQIHDYLAGSNFIIYLISSRTGLRDADIKFLTSIRTMGLMANLMFVVNVDLSEHDCLENLKSVENKIIKQLSYFTEAPEVYSLSTLYNLLMKTRGKCSDKDQKRIDLWNHEPELLEYTSEMSVRFERVLKERLDKERFFLLTANHLQRIKLLASVIDARSDLFTGLLGQDESTVSQAVEQLCTMQQKSRKLETMLTTSLDGSIAQLRQELDLEINRFFSRDREQALHDLRQFIKGYSFDMTLHTKEIARTGFHSALYTMYQNFRNDMDQWLASEWLPRVTGFVKEQEKRIETYFNSLYEVSHVNPGDVYRDFMEVSRMPSAPADTARDFPLVSMDINYIRGILGIELPGCSFATRYSAKIKVDSSMMFGVHSLISLFSRIVRKKQLFAEMPALNNAAFRIKKEFLKSIEHHFETYRVRISNDYLHLLVDAASRDFREKLAERFQGCHLEIDKIEHLIALEQSEKIKTGMLLDTVRQEIKKLFIDIDAIQLYDKN